MADPIITQEVFFEMLEKLPDGTFRIKFPKIKSKSGVTFDEHLADNVAHGVATKTEAEAGTSNVKYMTPLRVVETVKSMELNADYFEGKRLNQIKVVKTDDITRALGGALNFVFAPLSLRGTTSYTKIAELPTFTKQNEYDMSLRIITPYIGLSSNTINSNYNGTGNYQIKLNDNIVKSGVHPTSTPSLPIMDFIIDISSFPLGAQLKLEWFFKADTTFYGAKSDQGTKILTPQSNQIVEAILV